MAEPKYVNINDIEVVKNVRPDTGDVSTLMDSIKQHGLMEPIGVYKEKGKYYMLYGHRRLAALKKLGYTKLEVGKEIVIQDKTPDIAELMILNTTENIEREDIEPISLGAICSELKNAYGLSISEIAVRLSLPKGRVATAMSLYNKTPDPFKKDVIYIGTHKRKVGGLPATIQQKINQINNITQAEREILATTAKKEDLTSADISTIRTLVYEGHTLKTALEKYKEFRTLYLPVAVNREVSHRLELEVGKKISDIINERIKNDSYYPKDLFLKK